MADDNSSTSSSESPSHLPAVDSARRSELLTILAAVAIVALSQLALPLPEIVAAQLQHRKPYEFVEFAIDPRAIAGVSPRSRVVSTAHGLRGDDFRDDTFNILLDGGSNAYTELLDEGDALWRQIKRALPASDEQRRSLRVAADARGGQPLRHALHNIKTLLETPEARPAVIIAYFGAVEIHHFFTHLPWVDLRGQPTGAFIAPESPFSSVHWQDTFRGWYLPGNGGQFMLGPRRAYADHDKVDVMTPFMAGGLDFLLGKFAERMHALSALAREHDVELVWVTLPVNYGGPNSEARVEKWAFSFYRGGGRGFVPSPRLVAEWTHLFNQRLRAQARAQGWPLADLAVELRDCGECFYDQWHLTVLGARKAGEVIAAALPWPPGNHSTSLAH